MTGDKTFQQAMSLQRQGLALEAAIHQDHEGSPELHAAMRARFAAGLAESGIGASYMRVILCKLAQVAETYARTYAQDLAAGVTLHG